MKRCILLAGICLVAQGHDIITTSITWDRDISRIDAGNVAIPGNGSGDDIVALRHQADPGQKNTAFHHLLPSLYERGARTLRARRNRATARCYIIDIQDEECPV